MLIDVPSISWHITYSGIIFLINLDKEKGKLGIRKLEGHLLIFESAMD